MSSRARRLPAASEIEHFDWGMQQQEPAPSVASEEPERVSPVHSEEARTALAAEVERDAFAKGYAQGERSGAEAAAKRGEAMLRRLKETLEELTVLRADMLHRTERQMVQLALAIAKRIVERDISLDRSLLVGMARVALDRLGEHASATIRLHPDDYETVLPAGESGDADGHVRVVADPLVSRGGCLVQSDFGFMDVSPQAQFEELARALLEDNESATVSVPGPASNVVSDH